jgi:cob(I)alamin adenosyltransferase
MIKTSDFKYIHLVHGNGCGKSRYAFGTAMRAIDLGPIYIAQFIKGSKKLADGGVNSLKKLGVVAHSFGNDKIVIPNNVDQDDVELATKGFETAVKYYQKNKPLVFILDEINPALNLGLINYNDFSELITEIKGQCEIILTGRLWDMDLIYKLKIIADYDMEIKPGKHPFNTRCPKCGCEDVYYALNCRFCKDTAMITSLKARRGIEF